MLDIEDQTSRQSASSQVEAPSHHGPPSVMHLGPIDFEEEPWLASTPHSSPTRPATGEVSIQQSMARAQKGLEAAISKLKGENLMSIGYPTGRPWTPILR